MLILASGSPRRAKILKKLGVQFRVVKTDAEEVAIRPDVFYDSETTGYVVEDNACRKVWAGFKAAGGSAVGILAADTVVWFRNQILGKPKDLDEAAEYLRMMSGKVHSVFTGVAYLPPGATEDDEQRFAIVESKVKFRKLSDAMIDAYGIPVTFFVPGQYASALAIFSAGTSHTWLRDILGLDYAEMDALAEAAGVGAHGLFFNPTLAGGSSLDATPAMRGAFANLDLRHTRGDLVRAVMEGVAFGLRHALDALGTLVPVADPLILVGGGAKAPLWRQIYADVFDCRVIASAIGQQCAALGAAALAAVGTGEQTDFAFVAERANPAAPIFTKHRNAWVDGVSVDPTDAGRAAYRRLEPRHYALTAGLAAWAEMAETPGEPEI